MKLNTLTACHLLDKDSCAINDGLALVVPIPVLMFKCQPLNLV